MNDQNQGNNEGQPKIQIDDDWKAQARAEKERLAKMGSEQAGGEGEADEQQTGQQGGLPPADFNGLVSTMVTQALFAMGAIPDPQTGRRVAHLELARHHIDMLGVLEEKTKGNLGEEEQKMLSNALHELRSNYVQLSQHLMAQQQGEGQQGGGAAGGTGGAGGAGPTGPITPSA